MANTTGKKILYDGKPVQVDSAIRDGTGNPINETYVAKSTVSVPSTVPTASWGGTATIGSVDGKDFKIKMMSNPDTDTKVTETVSTTDNWYPILASPTANATATATTTSIFASGIKLNPAKTGIIGSQFGGYSKSYELQATGYKTILQMKDAATFWTTNSAIAYVTAKIEYSLVSFGSAATLDAKKAIWIVNAKYTGNDHSIDIKSIGDSVGTGNGILRYFASFAPKNSSYCPQIAVALDNANTKVYIRVTILSASEGWQCPSSIGGDPGTTNYNRWYVEAGRYNYTWSSNKIAANITGSCDGTAGATWDSLRNDRYLFGESAIAGSIMAKASDGRMYKLRNGADVQFTLPLHLGRCTGTFTYDGSVSPPTLTNYAQIMWNMRGMAYTELTNTSMQTTAFTVPTLTSDDFGKTLYITGTLSSNGNFKPDGNIVLAMVKGKTNIPIGRIDRANVALNTVPTQFTITGYSQTAYTLNSDGDLTHIDGKQIINNYVRQERSESNVSGKYPLLFCVSINSVFNIASTVVGGTRVSREMYAEPSQGKITAKHFYNSTTSSSLDFVVGSITSLTEVN